MRIFHYLFSSFLLLSSIGVWAAQTVHLTTPNLSEENIIGYNVGLRPHRSSGIRIEAEQLADKTIIHNYGHGGAGITLSWGSAQEAIKLMESQAESTANRNIAILGSGVNGLTVANQLLDRGYHVRIFAREFPPYTTSEIAAGLWDAFGVSRGETEEEKQRFKTIESVSYEHFHNLATSDSPRFAGASFVDAFYFYRDSELPSADAKRTVVDVEFDNGVRMPADQTRRIMIETPTYMQELMTEAKNKGAEFVRYSLLNRDELLNFDEDIIFNCMGLGSRHVFDDEDLKPVKGQLIYFKAQANINYIAAARALDPLYMVMFPYKDKFIIGGSYEEGEEHPVLINGIRDGILKNARHLFRQKIRERDEL